ncbi:MAG: hypothetical protein M3Z25_00680 [Actinomycetota bacterium]|nr:hypothetical protein [Actinomycetota bacterium]
MAVEEAGTFGWERYVGLDGVILGMATFGESAPLATLLDTFGFHTKQVIDAAHEAIRRAGRVQVERQS